MGDVIAARKAYEQAQVEARDLVAQARIKLGRSIRDARQQGVPQDTVARELGLTREQVRRFQEAADIADGLKAAKS
ncbi:hypothetical protein ACFVH6_22155 [Spirillospora sp. NPDC127200]